MKFADMTQEEKVQFLKEAIAEHIQREKDGTLPPYIELHDHPPEKRSRFRNKKD